jgi:hypothetical protein
MDPEIARLVAEIQSPDAARAAAAREALLAAGPRALHALSGSYPEHEAVRGTLFTILADVSPSPPPARLRDLLRWVQAAWRQYEDGDNAAAVHEGLVAHADALHALVPDLLREAGDPDPFVHGAAVRDLETLTHFLGPVGPEDGSVAAAFRAALADDCADVRALAAGGIANLAEDPGGAVPLLAALLRDPSAIVRAAAAEALSKFGAEAAPAFPHLAAALRDPSVAVADRAAITLAEARASGGEVLDALLGLLRRPEPEARFRACTVLASLDPPTREAVEALERAARGDAEEPVRQAAAEGLARLRARYGHSAGVGTML